MSLDRLLRFVIGAVTVAACAAGRAQESPAASKKPAGRPATPQDFRPYIERIPGTEVTFEMVPIPGGEFWMGSPPGEPGSRPDERPRHRVRISPFWMGKTEVTWQEYELWALGLDRTPGLGGRSVDGISRPTPPYVDMTFGMGHEGYPAICMTQHAAKTYCRWLSAKTGKHYRLPTEAEWEYACRAGTTTAYSFGDDPTRLGEYAWYAGNSEEEYHPVGRKKPNPFGLYDMHGNVAEWCLDQYLPDFYARSPLVDPLAEPETLYPRVVRGGSWEDPPELLRSAARRGSHEDWKSQDPQIPKSIWYHTDALFVGFRVVRPYRPDAKGRPKGPGAPPTRDEAAKPDKDGRQ